MQQWSYTGQSFVGAQSYAYMGGPGFSYTGGFTYSHSGSSHSGASHSGSSHSGASYAGMPLSPMLSAGISTSREDLNSGLMPSGTLGAAGDVGAKVIWGGRGNSADLPLMNQAALMRRWAPEVCSTLAEFELVSRLAFRCPVGTQTGAAVLFHVAVAPNHATSTPATLSALPIATLCRPDQAFFLQQLRKVESRASSRETRGPEILTQMDPPMGYFASIGNLHSQRTPKTLHLLALAQHFAYIIDMRFKHALACPRPVEYSAFIQPMIETPAHGSFPAGHAVESYMCAEVMQALIPGFARGSNPGKALRRLAQRIAENRVVAGLHFPVDCIAGRVLGDALAQYFVAMCTTSSAAPVEWMSATFNVDGLPSPAGAMEPTPDDSAIVALGQDVSSMPGCQVGALQSVAEPIPELAELWQHAQAEWA